MMVSFFFGMFLVSIEGNLQAVVYILGGKKKINSQKTSFQAGVSACKKENYI